MTDTRLSELFEKYAVPYLDKKQKADLAKGTETFMVRDIREEPGSFGQRWVFLISLRGEDWALTLSDAPARAGLFSELAKLVKDGPIGPLVMRTAESGKGRTYYTLAAAPERSSERAMREMEGGKKSAT